MSSAEAASLISMLGLRASVSKPREFSSELSVRLPNDFVVPASSALAFGNARPLLTCSHVHYFQQSEAHQLFDSLRQDGSAIVPLTAVLRVLLRLVLQKRRVSAPRTSRSDGPEHILIGDVREVWSGALKLQFNTGIAWRWGKVRHAKS